MTVSLVSIEGTDCRIMELGQVADKTGGQVRPCTKGLLAVRFKEVVVQKLVFACSLHANAVHVSCIVYFMCAGDSGRPSQHHKGV